MNLISLVLDAKLPLQLAYLPLILTTAGVLKVTSIKPDIKEICKNIKQHYSSHGFVTIT